MKLGHSNNRKHSIEASHSGLELFMNDNEDMQIQSDKIRLLISVSFFCFPNYNRDFGKNIYIFLLVV